MESGGDLYETLKKAPLRLVPLDAPALLPCLVGFKERACIEEARTAGKGRVGHGWGLRSIGPP